MKTNLNIKTLLLVAALAIGLQVNGQISTYTVDAYIDANNNYMHDVGEQYLPYAANLISIRTNCVPGSATTTFYGNCPGALFGGYTSVCNSGMIAYLNDLGAYLQPIFAPNNYTILANSSVITNVPVKSSILNQALITTIPTFYKNHNTSTAGAGGTIMPGITDTAFSSLPGLCSNSTLDFYTYFFGVRNLVNCNNLKNILNIKIDNSLIDSYTFIGSTVNNYSVYALSNGSITTNYSPLAPSTAAFSYSLTNYAMPSPGYHTLTIESVPIGMSYTATTVMQEVFYVSGYCGQISGNAFNDCNNNCIKDITEQYNNGAANILLSNATNTFNLYPNTSGSFTSNIPVGTYTLSSTNINPACSLTNTLITISSSVSTIVNIPLNPNAGLSLDDLSTYIQLCCGSSVPGGTFTVKAFSGKNTYSGCNGALQVNATKLKVVLAPGISYASPVAPTLAPNAIISATSGDTLVWNNPNANTYYAVIVNVATNVVIGNPYCLRTIITPINDLQPANNLYTACRVYGGPLDPNDKTAEAPNMASNGDILPNTNDLTYTVRFQNLGNAPAINVNISDSIDANLDLSTLTVLASSYPVFTQINNGSREVKFSFDGINLPPSSSNAAGSIGFVRYKVNLNSGLALGAQLKNRANIYFDYNSAVITNQTVNTISTITGINESEFAKTISLYPNPTNGNLNITTSTQIIKAEVLNAIGQIVVTKNNINANNTSIDLSNLPQGIYFVKLQASNVTVTKKIVKE